MQQMDQHPHAVSRRTVEIDRHHRRQRRDVRHDGGDGLCRHFGLQRPHQIVGRCQGRFGAGPRRGLSGMTAAYELRNAGYKVQMLEYNDRPGERNGRSMAATATPSWAASPSISTSTRAFISIPAPAHPLSSSRPALLLQNAECAARCLCDGELQRLCPFDQGVQRQAPALSPDRRRISTAIWASFWPRPHPRTSSTARITKDEKDGLLQVLRFWGALDKNYEYKKERSRQRYARLRGRAGRRL